MRDNRALTKIWYCLIFKLDMFVKLQLFSFILIISG